MLLKAEWSSRAVLCARSILFALAALEIGCRLWHGPVWLLAWPNLVVQERSGPLADMWRDYGYDAVSGYALLPGLSSGELHTDGDGFRIVPGRTAARADLAPIVAVGDSFTMGADVGDAESWPTVIETLQGRRVVNAGTPGYSLAQSVLRAELLAVRLRAAALVVGFIPDDVRRGEFSRRLGMEIPYFAPAGDGVVLSNAPPSPMRDDRKTLTAFQSLFGWSMLVDTVIRRTGQEAAWFQDRRRALPPGGAEPTVCPMMRRLARLGVPVIVVAQYESEMWGDDAPAAADQRRIAKLVLDCATAAGLTAIDLFDLTQAAVRDNGLGAVYVRDGHHTALGNRLAADAITAVLGL